MIAEEKKYIKAADMAEVMRATEIHEGFCRFIAGGTDLMANRFQGNESSPVLIDITGLKELKGICAEGQDLYLGPLTTLHEIENSELIKKEIPALAEAARSVGTPLIRRSATVGGNILCENRCLYYNQSEWWREAVGHCLKCNGDICIATGGANACFSEFVSDTAPVLISMQAEIKYISPLEKEKKVLLKDIYTGNGIKPRTIENNMLLTSIVIPSYKEYKCAFRKLRLRESLDFTSLTSAISVDRKKKVRITLAGMDPRPVYLEPEAGENVDEISKKLLKLSRAVDNDVFSRNYRREMVKVFVEDSFKKLDL